MFVDKANSSSVQIWKHTDMKGIKDGCLTVHLMLNLGETVTIYSVADTHRN